MLKKLKQKISNYLYGTPKTRDNDMLLQALIWINEYRAMGHKDNDLGKFLNYYSRQEFSNPSSIKRCRAKLQEQDPELRGKLYDKRHNKSVEVKNELRTFTI